MLALLLSGNRYLRIITRHNNITNIDDGLDHIFKNEKT